MQHKCQGPPSDSDIDTGPDPGPDQWGVPGMHEAFASGRCRLHPANGTQPFQVELSKSPKFLQSMR